MQFTEVMNKMDGFAEWAVTEAGRKAKYYGLTAAGRKQLAAREKSWEQMVKGVQAILRYT